MVLHPIGEQSCFAPLNTDPPGSARNWWTPLFVSCRSVKGAKEKTCVSFKNPQNPCGSRSVDVVRRLRFAYRKDDSRPVSGDALQFVTFFGGGLNQSIICWMLRRGHRLGSLLWAPTISCCQASRGGYMFIFRSSSGPHDPVHQHTHWRQPIHSHPHGRLRKSCALCSMHGEICRFTLLLNLVQRPSVSVHRSVCFCPSVHWDSGFEGRLVSDVCLSAGPTSQLLHCSPSPPSGKLICSRVLGPSAWMLPFNQHPTSMRLRSCGLGSCFE